MGTLAEIETAIEGLSPVEFEQLSMWMVDRHLHSIGDESAEPAGLEDEILAGAAGPFHPLTDETLERIRRRSLGDGRL